MYEDQKHSAEKEIKDLEKNLRLYVNGGFDGLRVIYYNYFQAQKIKFSDITPFDDFINTNDIERFYLDEVFFEVDNKYTTNVGFFIWQLCN